MNKRLHKLERIIRYEFNCFITLCYPKDKALMLLRHITNLLDCKVWYLYNIGEISLDEMNFMIQCNNSYYIYYVHIINSLY